MPRFIVLFRRADHADANSLPVEGPDIDGAIRLAIENCGADEYVCAVWQADTPVELLKWHVRQHDSDEDCMFEQIDEREWRCVLHDTVMVGSSAEPILCSAHPDRK